MMAETMSRLADRDVHQGHEPNQNGNFKAFMDTKPPTFKEAKEPLQANEWLNTIEQSFRLVRLDDVQKVEFASYQLQGPAGIWWANYAKTLPPNAVITWEQFCDAFRGHYIPPGLMAILFE